MRPGTWTYAEEFIPEPELIERARVRGDELGAVPVGTGTGAALRMLAAANHARSVVEIGTSAGVSGLWLLSGMPADGVVTGRGLVDERPVIVIANDPTVKAGSWGARTVEKIVRATEGSDGIALGSLLAKTGYTTFDGGFVNTASTKSAITYIDGDAGILRYRGYPIEQLAEKSTFMEVAKLLMDGELPSEQELESFRKEVRARAEMPEGMKDFFKSFPTDAHPMPVLSSAISALCTYDTENLDPFDPEQLENASRRLMGQVPVLAANAYRNRQGLPPMQADTSLTVVENFLRMTFADAEGNYELDERMVRALDMLFVLHADHEQNASTSTVRLAGSSGANPFACIAAGMAASGATWGPRGGVRARACAWAFGT